MSAPVLAGPHHLALLPPLLLLVEDEDLLRAAYALFLGREGYTVLEAGDAWEALQLVERVARPIALLLTDVRLPGMSGLALAQRLVARRPGLRVLYLAGNVGDILAGVGSSGSRAEIMEKPFALEALACKVREMLADAGARQESTINPSAAT
jgi:DNA-binding response OmpR family regulator